MHSKWVNRLLFVLTLLVLSSTVVILINIEQRVRGEIESVVDATEKSFSNENALKTPGDIRVSFAKLEELGARARTFRLIRHLYVSKNILGNKNPVLLYPFYYAGLHPDWEMALDAMRKAPIYAAGNKGEQVGTLYFDLDRATLRAVQISIGVTMGLIIVVLLALLSRVFTQQRDLTTANVILEEKQREMIRLERLSLAGLLTANIFHDIRKPITNIKHELGDMSEALGGFAGATRALKSMRDQINLFFDILRELNIERFVKSDEADEEYVDINRVVEQSLSLVQYERGATQLTITLSNELPLVLAYPYRLIQVFSNIILNAYQALNGHGELRIATRLEEGKVVVEFQDNGPGIPMENSGKIFDPFHTTKPVDKGTGLGLYICRSIVEGMGGTISMESKPNDGAKFTINLRPAE